MHVRITTLQRVHSRLEQEQKKDQDLWCGRRSRRRRRRRRDGAFCMKTNLSGPHVSNHEVTGLHSHPPRLCCPSMTTRLIQPSL